MIIVMSSDSTYEKNLSLQIIMMQQDPQTPSLAFIGAGHLGSAMITGLLSAGYPPQVICATRRNQQALDALKSINVQSLTDNDRAINQADIVLLAVRPQQLCGLLNRHQASLSNRSRVIVSLAAGIPCSTITEILPQQIIVRAMPNLTARQCLSTTGLFTHAPGDAPQRTMINKLFERLGITVWLRNEDQMHAFTALAGSGAAYFYYLMQAMEKSALAAGFTANETARMLAQTALGAVTEVASVDNATTLLRKIQVPQGTTEAAIEHMENARVGDAIQQGITAAIVRSQQLAGH